MIDSAIISELVKVERATLMLSDTLTADIIAPSIFVRTGDIQLEGVLSYGKKLPEVIDLPLRLYTADSDCKLTSMSVHVESQGNGLYALSATSIPDKTAVLYTKRRGACTVRVLSHI